MKKVEVPLAVLIIAFATLIWVPPAASCGGPWDVACNVGKTIEKAGQDVGREGGRIIDQGRTDLSNGLNRIDPRITQIGRDIDRMRLEFQSSVFTGPALEQWIIQSRNNAMNGAIPMPPIIRQALQGWYSDDLMNLVRFKVGDGGELNLANNSMRFGHATAVTLIDVIVFRGPAEASNAALWAHEMKHVQQYQEWGVHSFAVQYMRSWNGIENPAYAVEAEYNQNPGPRFQNFSQSPGYYPPPQNVYQPPPQQAAVGRICSTQIGWCYVQVPTPIGFQCGCSGPYGPVGGVVQ